MIGDVSLEVRQEGELELRYASLTIAQAVELIAFLREFLPKAEFVVQPVLH